MNIFIEVILTDVFSDNLIKGKPNKGSYEYILNNKVKRLNSAGYRRIKGVACKWSYMDKIHME